MLGGHNDFQREKLLREFDGNMVNEHGGCRREKIFEEYNSFEEQMA